MTDKQTDLHNNTHPFRLKKAERMSSLLAIENLFSPGSKSLSAYPVRAVYKEVEGEGVPVEILISVAKRHLRHAVDRNRVKRQLREAYRLNKHILWDVVEAKRTSKSVRVSLAFMWLADEVVSSKVVTEKVKNLLLRISEKI